MVKGWKYLSEGHKWVFINSNLTDFEDIRYLCFKGLMHTIASYDDIKADNERVVKPIYNTGLQIAQTVGNLINPDQYRLINSVAELAKGVPPCMQEGIIYYKPIRDGINSGKYDGFGVDPSKLASSDPYEKICESGYYEYDNSTVSDNGEIHVEIEQCSDDPVLTPMEEVDLSMTRKFLFDFINDEDTGILDPTSYPDLHG